MPLNNKIRQIRIVRIVCIVVHCCPLLSYCFWENLRWSGRRAEVDQRESGHRVTLAALCEFAGSNDVVLSQDPVRPVNVQNKC